ncbi:putative phosphohydrolase [Tritrichomonas foetus]|uniref:Phosphohydrolase n=1 Tax=Tritrichomonas foetus TaxID=1144522 RepID=A0A1J4J9L1_9EUKA|nr:putative phosphohydrolase [Tritrichomonas foetus]|eukprot:OHS95353.1 putative phosphohydrolase [Tritrichomonas foetus]
MNVKDCKRLCPQTENHEQKRKKFALVFSILLFSIFLFCSFYSFFYSSLTTKSWKYFYFISIVILIYCCVEPFLLKFTYQEIVINKNFEPFTVVHLTDIHIVSPYPYSTESKLKKIVSRVNQLNPDFIFLTGDFITRARTFSGSCKNADAVCRALSRLKARNGIFAVLGNNDLCAYDYLEQKLSEINIKILRQESVNVGNFLISGIDTSKTFNIARNRLNELQHHNSHSHQNVDAHHNLKILLAHEPDVAAVACEYGFDIQFSGHSHGGQISIPFGIGPLYLPKMGKLYPNGLFIIKKMLLFVSPGIGISTLPKPLVRLNCRPEVSVLRILPSEDSEHYLHGHT